MDRLTHTLPRKPLRKNSHLNSFIFRLGIKYSHIQICKQLRVFLISARPGTHRCWVGFNSQKPEFVAHFLQFIVEITSTTCGSSLKVVYTVALSIDSAYETVRAIVHCAKKPVTTVLTYPGNVQFYIVTTWETPGNHWC